MKKVIFLIATLLSFAGMSAQSNDNENIERYKQLLKLNHQSYETLYEVLIRWPLQ